MTLLLSNNVNKLQENKGMYACSTKYHQFKMKDQKVT